MLHRALQLDLVVSVVAGGRRSGTAQDAQGEAHAQRIGVVGQGCDIDRLQVGRLDRGIQLGRVLFLGRKTIGDRTAH
ncbi:hypothetical protein SDC9_142149 [bioreactor metagenome]|uniref:Uncharacterized protein n=1 Tax=bioreactor metagenome TaxID=1076179 RepID=A0A645DZP5_9ZZZZ